MWSADNAPVPTAMNTALQTAMAHAESVVGKENVASHPKGATLVGHPKGTTLLVPAAAWHALHMRVDDLQTQNVTLAKEQAECTRYLKAFLKMEHHRRERAATRLQAAARGMLSRKRHPRRTRRSQSHTAPMRSLRLSPSQLHVSRAAAAAPRQRRIVTLEARSCTLLQAAARGAIVRTRLSALLAGRRACTRLQAAARGMLSRGRHAHALEKHRWSLRFTTLESALQQERRARKAQEAALRKLWADVAALTQALASVAPAREAPGADGLGRLS
jgi:hypothetical protein